MATAKKDNGDRKMTRYRNIDASRVVVTISAILLALLTAALFFLDGPSSWWKPEEPKFIDMATGLPPKTPEDAGPLMFTFEAVGGVFMQSDEGTDEKGFDYTKTNLGLIDRPYPTDTSENASEPAWLRFAAYLKHLVTNAPEGTTYKVLLMGRHGEGYHNVAEAFYGTEAWDEHWSKLDGNGTITWSDAKLTETGKEQALAAHNFIAEQFAYAKMPAPQSYYVSPMWRCLQTADLTWSWLNLPAESMFRPVVKELLRETLGVHTCDRRSQKWDIRRGWLEWRFEKGFEEFDELWREDWRETHEEHDERTRELLNDLWRSDRNVWVSLTTHSGAIASFLRVLGHRKFALPTGGMIPVLVKGVRVE